MLNGSAMADVTGIVLYLVRKSNRTETFHILFILSVNLSHIIIGGLDQFIANIVYSRGSTSQVCIYESEAARHRYAYMSLRQHVTGMYICQ